MIWCIYRAKFGAWHTGSSQYGQLNGIDDNDDGGSGGIDPPPPAPKDGL